MLECPHLNSIFEMLKWKPIALRPQATKSKQSKVPKADDDYREHGSLAYKSGNCPIPQNSASKKKTVQSGIKRRCSDEQTPRNQISRKQSTHKVTLRIKEQLRNGNMYIPQWKQLAEGKRESPKRRAGRPQAAARMAGARARRRQARSRLCSQGHRGSRPAHAKRKKRARAEKQTHGQGAQEAGKKPCMNRTN